MESVRVRRFRLRQENKCLYFRGIPVSRVELVKKAVRAPPEKMGRRARGAFGRGMGSACSMRRQIFSGRLKDRRGRIV